MIRTRVGYTGGTEPGPTYHDLGSHSEAIQIVYDPKVIDYETLLATFWASHRPVAEPWSVQYRSAIFVHDAGERAVAEATLKARSDELGTRLYTTIEPLGVFWPAEDYHQKYRLRHQTAVVEALERRHGDRWIDSKAAAKLNGLYGGYALAVPVETLGLDEATAAAVVGYASRR